MSAWWLVAAGFGAGVLVTLVAMVVLAAVGSGRFERVLHGDGEHKATGRHQ